MAVKVKARREKTREFVVDIDGEKLTGVCRPDYLTPELLEKSEQAEKGGEMSRSLCDMVLGAVVSWDLVEDDASPAPIELTHDGLSTVPINLLSQIVTAIIQAQGPNAKRSGR